MLRMNLDVQLESTNVVLLEIFECLCVLNILFPYKIVRDTLRGSHKERMRTAVFVGKR